MKTIRFKEENGFKIIERFDELPIDPVRTQRVANKIINKLSEVKEINNLISFSRSYREKSVMAEARILSSQKIQAAAESLLERTKIEFEKTNLNIQIQRSKSLISDEKKNKGIFDAKIKEFEGKILEFHKILDKKRAEILKENTVYAFLHKNEIALTNDEFEEISSVFNNKGPCEQIAIEFDEIESIVVEADENQPEIRDIVRKIKGSPRLINDMRGKQFFWKDQSGKWHKSKDAKLGERKDDLIPSEFHDIAFEQHELDDDSKEEIRIQSLDTDQKAHEKEQKIREILRESAIKRMELEIEGNPDALKISQDFYKTEMIALEKKFKD